MFIAGMIQHKKITTANKIRYVEVSVIFTTQSIITYIIYPSARQVNSRFYLRLKTENSGKQDEKNFLYASQ